MTRTKYEWQLEECDKHFDVLDRWPFSTIASALCFLKQGGVPDDGCHFRLVLVRDVWDTEFDSGIEDRDWAYPSAEGACEFDRWQTPKRYRAELAKHLPAVIEAGLIDREPARNCAEMG